jgi:hypothetical protein
VSGKLKSQEADQKPKGCHLIFYRRTCRYSRTKPVVEGLLDPAYKQSKEVHLDETFSVIEERRDDRRGSVNLRL